ncbi:MAG: hypothetical protein WCT44_02005 [Candidatus Paceibacterota bacterium]
MHEEHKKIIVKAIEDSFRLKDKYSDYELNSNFQLLLTQLDLFKTISTLVVAIVGIGFFFKDQLDLQFLILSLTFSLFTVIGTISYTREIVDFEAKEIKRQGDIFKEKMDEVINAAVDAIQRGDAKIYFDYAAKEAQAKYLKERVVYAGEIFAFCFYNSISFGLLALMSEKYSFNTISFITIGTLIFTHVISFKDWARPLVDFLSKELKKKW